MVPLFSIYINSDFVENTIIKINLKNIYLFNGGGRLWN